MGLSTNRIVYGIHSIAPFRRTDKLPYGILKVIGGGTLTFSAEFEELFGGSNKNAWAVEAKTISTEWTATVKSMPNFLFKLFLGASVATTAASSTGTIDAIANKLGTSVQDAATGIASVSLKAGEEAKLKDGHYVVKAVSPTTVDVYDLTDIEFKKDSASVLSYVDDSLKITDTPLTIVTGATVEIPNTGLELTGGSGAIAMVALDTAVFKVMSPHGGLSVIDIGASSTTFPEHSQLCLAQKRADGSVFEIELYKVIGAGFPIPLEEQAFSIPELAMKLVYDDCEDKVATIRAKAGVSVC